MIGWSAGIAGLRLLLADQAAPVSAAEWAVAGLTLATMAALNVWGKGLARMLCALIGLTAGYVAAGFMLRKCADRLRSQHKDGRASVHLHYDH